MDKQGFAALVEEIRGMIESGSHADCPCPKRKCEWHGKCHECVMIHRYYGNHVPNCLQPILADKIRALAKAAELLVEPKPKTPDEYWDYVNEIAPPER